MTDQIDEAATALIELAGEIVAAYVTKNALSPSDLPKLIVDVYNVLEGLGRVPPLPVGDDLRPAVPVRKSITPDFLICLEDGKKFKSMKRHLSGLGMTPAEYRAKWSLPLDYPMVAPNYAATRSTLAKSNGLGRKASFAAIPVASSKKPVRAKTAG